MNVIYFKQASGKEPVKEYIDKLPNILSAQVLTALKDIKENGIVRSLITCRQIEGKLWEIKLGFVCLNIEKKRRNKNSFSFS